MCIYFVMLVEKERGYVHPTLLAHNTSPQHYDTPLHVLQGKEPYTKLAD